MDERKLRERVHHAIDTHSPCHAAGPYRVQRVLKEARAMQGTGGTVVKRKLSVGFVLMVAVMLLCATAVATGIVMSVMTSRVAEMDAQGQFMTWGLDEKYAFVLAMRDSGFDMNEDDWAILTDEDLPASEREAAADRIVYDRYGAVQEEANAQRPMPRESVMGEAPDAVLIFRERFLAENPEATYYDYLDALGYWLRDEYYPQVDAAQPTVGPAAEDDRLLTREMAEDSFRGHLTEVFSWPVAIAKEAQLVSEQDAESGAWHVTSAIDASALRKALGAMADEAMFDDAMITLNGNSYVVSYWVTRADNGDWVRAESLEVLLVCVEETNRIDALHTIYVDGANEIGVQAIAEKYGLSDAEVRKYFVYNGDTYWNDPSCVRVAVLLRTRNNAGAPWDYAAIVNMTTAQADDVFAASDLPEKAAHLAESWDQLQENDEWLNYYRIFSTWNPYGWYADAPAEEWRKICEPFQELVREQQESLTNPNDYYPLQIFELRE